LPLVRWDDADWRAWRPEEAAQRLEDLAGPWYVAAGWAIDLFVGYERRAHDDLEIAAPAESFPEIHALLDDLEFYAVGDGEVTALAESPERFAETHQTWGLDPTAFEWRIDVFREPSVGGDWICRRRQEIRLPYDEVIERTANGIPYVRPEVALLFKAKAARPKDEEDLNDVLPLLAPSRRALLHSWIALVHPGHAWLERLA
jgi:Aminoglycoside-2''-adenylyltransferase